MNATDVTTKTFFERLYLFPELSPSKAPSQLSVCPHTPFVHTTTISRFPCNFFPQTARQFCFQHDSPSNLAESWYPGQIHVRNEVDGRFVPQKPGFAGTSVLSESTEKGQGTLKICTTEPCLLQSIFSLPRQSLLKMHVFPLGNVMTAGNCSTSKTGRSTPKKMDGAPRKHKFVSPPMAS